MVLAEATWLDELAAGVTLASPKSFHGYTVQELHRDEALAFVLANLVDG